MLMRIIAKKTLVDFWSRHPSAEQPLRAWHDEALKTTWATPQELKQQYKSASIINDKRVVFNIHGNTFRLIVDIEYRLKIVFIVWIGTHKKYDKLEVAKVKYASTDKNKKTTSGRTR